MGDSMKNLMIIVFIIINSTPSYAAKIKHHKIYDLRAALGNYKCEAWAKELGTQFSNQAKIKIKSTLCEQSPVTNRINVIISYESEKYIPVISTYTFANTYANKGIYKNKEECLDHLEVDTEFFIQKTDLVPYAAFCSAVEYNVDTPWFPHIEAIGNSELIPMRTGWESGMPYGLSKEQMFLNIEKGLLNLDIHLQHLTWNRGFMESKFSLFGYGNFKNPRLSLFSKTVANINGLNKCIKKAEQLKNEILAKGQFPLLTTYCSSPYLGPKSFDIEIVGIGFNFLNLNKSVETFTSDIDCEVHRPIIEEKYAIAFGENKIIGSTCESNVQGSEIFFQVVIINR